MFFADHSDLHLIEKVAQVLSFLNLRFYIGHVDFVGFHLLKTAFTLGLFQARFQLILRGPRLLGSEQTRVVLNLVAVSLVGATVFTDLDALDAGRLVLHLLDVVRPLTRGAP